MIPMRLTLQNFLSYSEAQIVDFSQFDLAVLSGNNGVGKSSLLEAITWTIWGKTRALSDDDLIRKGSGGMWVELIFENEKNIYRILRKREKKNKTGISVLEFQIAHGKQKNLKNKSQYSWKSLAEPSIRETQEKIIKTLRLSYDVFVNSSYLRQGHADEFTIKKPTERKETLGEILGFSYYEELEKRAKEKIKNFEQEEKLLNFKIDTLKNSLFDKEKINLDFEKISEDKKQKEKKINHEQEKLSLLEKEKQEYELASQEKEFIQKRYREITVEIDTSKLKSQNARTKLEKFQKILNLKEKIINNLEKISRLKRLSVELENSLKKNLELKSKEHDLEKLIMAEKHNLEMEKGILLSQIEAFRNAAEDKKNLNNLFFNLRQETKKTSPNCPLCEQNLTSARIKQLEEKFFVKLNEAKKKEDVFREAKERLEKINLALTKNNFAPDLQKKLLKIQAEIKNNFYDEKKHNDVRNNLTKSSPWEDLGNELKIAENQSKILQEEINFINKEIENKSKERGEIEKRGLALEKRIEFIEPKIRDTRIQEEKTQILAQELKEIEAKLTALAEKKKNIEINEQEYKDSEKKLKNIISEKIIFNTLSEAFGKKGIQAMIIEEEIPHIEEEANFLLAKITDGRMKLKFETKRMKKGSEEEIETLDIQIADELGTRNYEMYSGGEAFRINFAVRIALSKLLSFRAGAKLRFLVIDEGFGTLDTAGQEDVIAAINSIKNDFSKIIIVTHLAEIRDVFPNRINVYKDSGGSKIVMY